MTADLSMAQKDEAQELEDFLALNNGERVRQLAHDYVCCSFSNDYRKPCFVVAKIDGKIIGAAAFSEEFFTTRLWGISWVSVHEDHRKHGIGESLVRKCLNEIAARVDKKVNVMLGTYPEKTGLYDKTGFAKLGQDYSGGWFMTTTVGEER